MRPRVRSWTLLLQIMAGVFLPSVSVFADSYASSATNCQSAGFDYGVEQVAGRYKGMFRCFCNSPSTQAALDTQNGDLFTMPTLSELNGVLNSSPDFETLDATVSGRDYVLQSELVEGIESAGVYFEDLLAGYFASGEISGSQETSALSIDGSGQPDGGFYNRYSGIITSAAVPEPSALVLAFFVVPWFTRRICAASHAIS